MSALTSTIQNYIYGPDKFTRPKKNFIKENMKLIKRMQMDPKEKNDSKKCSINKRSGKKGQEEKSSTIISHSSYEKIISIDKMSKPGKDYDCKEQGCQTSTNDLDGGQVRFPKDRATTPPPPEGKKNMSLQVNQITDLVYKSPDAIAVLTPSQLPVKEDGKIDFVKLNMLVTPKKRPPIEKHDPIKAPPTYQRGVVPKYLREAKRQQIEEVQEKGLVEIIDDLDENCYDLVSEEQKKQRLREIRLAYAQLVTELNMLPIRSDSPRIQSRRSNIESTLQKLEDGIKLFSREKLYIKIGQ